MESILLVDDDKNFRRSLAISLETLGYKVFEAKSGMDALQFLKNNQQCDDRVKGIIVDARMPGLDGFWLTDQILAMYPQLRVIILSAHPYPTNLDRYTFFTKPVKIDQLTQVLERSY